MNIRKLRNLATHARHVIARALRRTADGGWLQTLSGHAELLRNLALTTAVLGALALTVVLATSTADERPPAAAPITSSATVPSPSRVIPTSPAPEPGAGPVPTPQQAPPAPAQGASHPVVSRDTLAAIALRYGVPFELLAADNGIADPNRIWPGQRLAVRPPAAGIEVIRPGTTLSWYARRAGTSVATLTAINPHIADADHILAGGLLRLNAGAGR